MEIKSKHGKKILENSKYYDTANDSAEKIDLENNDKSPCGNSFCRKNTWNIMVLCRTIYLIYHYIVPMS